MSPQVRPQRSLHADDLTIETIPIPQSNGQCNSWELNSQELQIESLGDTDSRRVHTKFHRPRKFFRRLLVTLGIIFTGLGFFLTLITYLESITYDSGRISGPVLLACGLVMLVTGTTWVCCKQKRKEKVNVERPMHSGFENDSLKAEASAENGHQRSGPHWREYENQSFENELSPKSLKYSIGSPNKLHQTADFNTLYEQKNDDSVKQTGHQNLGKPDTNYTYENGATHTDGSCNGVVMKQSNCNTYVVTAECHAYNNATVYNNDDTVYNNDDTTSVVSTQNEKKNVHQTEREVVISRFSSFRTASRKSGLEFGSVIKSSSLNNLAVLPETPDTSIERHHLGFDFRCESPGMKQITPHQ